MKTCTRCRLEKPFQDFPKDKNKKDGLSYRCKKCSCEHNRIHYHYKKRAFLDNLKNFPCFDCGIKYPPYVMHFDHVPELGEKKSEISDMWSHKEETILAEVAKCQLVCSNCHAVRTYKRRMSNL